MVISPAWQKLTSKQKELYIVCKLQYYGQKDKDIENIIVNCGFDSKIRGEMLSLDEFITLTFVFASLRSNPLGNL